MAVSDVEDVELMREAAVLTSGAEEHLCLYLTGLSLSPEAGKKGVGISGCAAGFSL